jgi:hypothetical protein
MAVWSTLESPTESPLNVLIPGEVVPVFASHLTLVSLWLDRRRDIVEAIDARLLNVRDKPLSRSRDRRPFEQQWQACFFQLPGLPVELARLKGQLEARRAVERLEPMALDAFVHQLDPLEFVVRAYEHWHAHRWPGKSGRIAFAHTLFSAFVLRQLELLTLRLWDDGHAGAGERLGAVQALLDRLNGGPSAGTFVRDARWLVQTAQGPFTLEIAPYFRIAEHVAASFTDEERVGIHVAGAKLAGGHLRSQRRYGTWRTGLAAHDPEILAFTRNSNAMDHALLVRDLAGLLRAYRVSIADQADARRAELADAILQGIAVDPELFLVRLDLLAPYIEIEPLCVAADATGAPQRTPLGRDTVRLCGEYCALVGELAPALLDDAEALNPADQPYSPLGIVYGFAADILSNMAMDALVGHPSLGLSLEDVFAGRGRLDRQIERARGWRRLPRRAGEREHFEHTPEFAREVFDHLLQALRARVAHPNRANASDSPDVRLLVVPEGGTTNEPVARDAVSGQQFLLTSDAARAAATGATEHDRAQLVKERNEGGYLATAEVAGQWWAITKTVLTFATLQPQAVVLTDVPPVLLEPLRLACPGMIDVLG